jgi:condensin complex subunit 3
MRDVDPVTRKLVYTSLLGGKLKHPKQLTITQREVIVKDGLGDREPGVRVAAGKVVGSLERMKGKRIWVGREMMVVL